MAQFDRAAALAALGVFFPQDQDIELRAFWAKGKGKPKVWRGRERKDALDWAAAQDKNAAKGIFVVMNPFGEVKGKAVKDDEVTKRTWFLIDVDAVREPGVSATKKELKAAHRVVKKIWDFLEAEGWPKPFVVKSGNGGHLMYRVDLEGSDGKGVLADTDLVRFCLEVLSWKFDTDAATVDKKVFNLSRIWKLPGTMARKGVESEERPWRQAKLVQVGSKETVRRKLLESLAKRIARGEPDDDDTADLGKLKSWLHANWPSLGEPKDYLGGTARRWIFGACPWDADHRDRSAYVVRFASGAIVAGCLHSRCAGATRDDDGKSLGWRGLQKLANKPYKGRGSVRTGASTGTLPGLTDLGNAKRLVRLFSSELRYAPQWGSWMAWDGRRWKEDKTGKVMRLAADTVATIFAEAEAEADEDRTKAYRKWALRSESSGKLNAMVELARWETGMSIPVESFDNADWVLNVKNGTLRLKTGELKPHRRSDNITKLAPITYDSKAECPRWDKFLAQTFGGSKDLTAFIQRALGYAMTGSVREQVMFFCHGTGANGKTTFLRIVQYVLGDYAIQTDPTILMQSMSGFDSHPTGFTDLLKVRFAGASETERGRQLAEALVKQLTGDDMIVARRMRQDFIRFFPTHKLWMAANYKPVIKGNDIGIWRRIRYVPFEVTVPEKDRDRELLSKLKREAPGILAWMVRGCLAWQQAGLSPPEIVLEKGEAYKGEMDVLKEFFEDCTEKRKDGVVPKKELYEAYRDWCEDRYQKPSNYRYFGTLVRERGYGETVGKADQEDGQRTSVRCWTGLNLGAGRPLGQIVDVDFERGERV